MAITAKISVDNSELKQGMKQAEQAASSSMKNIKSTTSGAGKALSELGNNAKAAGQAINGSFSGMVQLMGKAGAVAGAIAGAIGLAVAAAKKIVDTAKKHREETIALDKEAKAAGMTTQAYVSLQYAALKTGTDLNTVISVIKTLNSAVYSAADGLKTYRNALYSIELSWRDLEKMSPEKRFVELGKAMQKYTKTGLQLPDDFKTAFKREQIDQFKEAAKNPSEFGRMAALASQQGFVISEAAIKNAYKMNQELELMEKLQGMIIKNSKLMKAGGLEKQLKNLKTSFLDNIFTKGKTGFISKNNSAEYEGIGDMAVRMARTGTMKQDDLVYLLADIFDKTVPTPEGTYKFLNGSKIEGIDKDPEIRKILNDPLIPERRKALRDALKKMSNKNNNRYLNSMLKDIFENLDWDAASKDKTLAVLNAHLKQFDPRFDLFNKDTWVQENLNAKQQTEQTPHTLDRYDDIMRHLTGQRKAYEDILDKKEGIFDVEKEIVDLEKKLKSEAQDVNKTLDERLKTQLRLASAMHNQKYIMTQLKQLEERGKQNRESSMLGIAGQAGFNTTDMGMLFSAYKAGDKNFNPMKTLLEKGFFAKNLPNTNTRTEAKEKSMKDAEALVDPKIDSRTFFDKLVDSDVVSNLIRFGKYSKNIDRHLFYNQEGLMTTDEQKKMKDAEDKVNKIIDFYNNKQGGKIAKLNLNHQTDQNYALDPEEMIENFNKMNNLQAALDAHKQARAKTDADAVKNIKNTGIAKRGSLQNIQDTLLDNEAWELNRFIRNNDPDLGARAIDEKVKYLMNAAKANHKGILDKDAVLQQEAGTSNSIPQLQAYIENIEADIELYDKLMQQVNDIVAQNDSREALSKIIPIGTLIRDSTAKALRDEYSKQKSKLEKQKEQMKTAIKSIEKNEKAMQKEVAGLTESQGKQALIAKAIAENDEDKKQRIMAATTAAGNTKDALQEAERDKAIENAYLYTTPYGHQYNQAKDDYERLQKQKLAEQHGFTRTDYDRNSNVKKIIDDLYDQQESVRQKDHEGAFKAQTQSTHTATMLNRANYYNFPATSEIWRRRQMLEQRGITASPDNLNKYRGVLDDLINEQNAANNQNFGQSLIGNMKSARWSLMQRGTRAQQKQAHTEQWMDNAKSANGGNPLTQAQQAMVRQAANLDWKRQKLEEMNLQTRNDVVYSNDLAARGGFRTSVAVDTQDSNKRIEAYVAQIAKLTQQIATHEKNIETNTMT